MGVTVDVDISPLDGMRHVWELGTVRSWMRDGLVGSVIEPVGVFVREVPIGNPSVVASPVAKGEQTSLDAKLPLMSEILKHSSLSCCVFNVVELLMLVLLNPLIKIAWDSWEVVESWGVDSIFVFTSDNKDDTRLSWIQRSLGRVAGVKAVHTEQALQPNPLRG